MLQKEKHEMKMEASLPKRIQAYTQQEKMSLELLLDEKDDVIKALQSEIQSFKQLGSVQHHNNSNVSDEIRSWRPTYDFSEVGAQRIAIGKGVANDKKKKRVDQVEIFTGDDENEYDHMNMNMNKKQCILITKIIVENMRKRDWVYNIYGRPVRGGAQRPSTLWEFILCREPPHTEAIHEEPDDISQFEARNTSDLLYIYNFPGHIPVRILKSVFQKVLSEKLELPYTREVVIHAIVALDESYAIIQLASEGFVSASLQLYSEDKTIFDGLSVGLPRVMISKETTTRPSYYSGGVKSLEPISYSCDERYMQKDYFSYSSRRNPEPRFNEHDYRTQQEIYSMVGSSER
jgi:hypothetical protein